jgi:prolyl-tRNA synthetase
MIMIHSDNTGVVLPPRVAQVQVVIIPILFKNDDGKAIVEKAWELAKELKQAGIRVQVDDRDNHNPGFKFNNWEVKGTPVRLELGSKDFEKGEVKVAVRHSGEKFQTSHAKLGEQIVALLDRIHTEMYEKALAARDSHLKHADNWKDFMVALNNKNICLAPWCDTVECEKKIKEESKTESIATM